MNKLISTEEFIELIKEYFPNPKCFVEIGSLDGTDSSLFKQHFPNSQVYAIEGLPNNYDLFLKNKIDIIPINRVVYKYNGTIRYHKKNINGLHGVLDRGQEYGTDTLILDCSTFESIKREFNIPDVDIFKIDVEGAAYEILCGMTDDILEKVKMIHIETEYQEFFKGQKLHDEVIQYLSRYRFQILKMSSVPIEKGKWQNDVVLIKGDI